jgi:hypothetical protein
MCLSGKAGCYEHQLEGRGVSFQAMAWAVRQKLPCTQKMVLMMLAERHNRDTGRCDPSLDLLAEDCGLSRRSVMDQVARLAEAGYLRILHRASNNVKLSNQYVLVFSFGVQEEVKEPVGVVNVLHQGSERAAPGVVNVLHQGSERAAHKPGIEPGIEPGGGAGAHADPLGGGKDVGKVASAGRLKAVRRTPLPTDLRPSDAVAAFADSHGLNLPEEVAAFCDHHAAHGTTMVDWQAGLRTWLRNAVKFRARDERVAARRGASGGGAQHRYAGAAAAIYEGVL